MEETFAAVLQAHLRARQYTPRRLALLTDIPEDTIKSWLGKRCRRVRDWPRLLLVAAVLGLSAQEAQALFDAAGAPGAWRSHPLLQRWLPSLPSADMRAVVEQWLAALAGGTAAPGLPQPPAAPAPGLAAWLRDCEASARAGAADDLGALLARPPASAGRAHVLFYCGQWAVAQADYRAAAQHFHSAHEHGSAGGDLPLSQQARLWQAYCFALLGEYRVAQALLDSVVAEAPDSAVLGHYWFVCGLLTTYTGSLWDAERALFEAHTIAVCQGDRWMERRCCANLAAIYQHLGMMDRVARQVHRLELLGGEGAPEPRRALQLRNITLNRLRLQGDLGAALELAPAMDVPVEQGSRQFHGWLVLSAASAAMDADQLELAECYWERAASVLSPLLDGGCIEAELLWQRAWLRFRQGWLGEAHADIQAARVLIDDQADTDYLHAWAIAGIIAHARADFAEAQHHLLLVVARFRSIHHNVGLLSALFHLARCYLSDARPLDAAGALAEALTLAQQYQLYGAYYWDTALMLQLCPLAMRGDLWVEQGYSVAEADRWGEAAAALAARRLAAQHWRAFVPLLEHRSVRVRRRAALVLAAARHSDAAQHLQGLPSAETAAA